MIDRPMTQKSMIIASSAKTVAQRMHAQVSRCGPDVARRLSWSNIRIDHE
jgi:hypothetical protein